MVVSGNGADARQLIERFLVEGIDPLVQVLIGQVLVQALRSARGTGVRSDNLSQDSLSIVRFSAPLVSEATT